MAEAFIGIGSNIEPQRHVATALTLLTERFGDLVVSTIYRSRAVGFDGNDFLNLVVALNTQLNAPTLYAELHTLETRCGRDRSAPRFAPRSIDLDLLLYNDSIIDQGPLKLPRKDILRYAFMLQPLAEIAAERRHPQTGLTFAQHWQQFVDDEPALVPISLDEDGLQYPLSGARAPSATER